MRADSWVSFLFWERLNVLACFLACFDTAENEPCKVCPIERCRSVYVNLVDLVKSFHASSREYLLAKFGFDTAENRTSLVKFARSPRTDPPGAGERDDGAFKRTL